MDVIRFDQIRERANDTLDGDDIGLIAAIVIALGFGLAFTAWLVGAVIF